MPDSSRPDRAEAQRHVDRIRAFRAELEQLISNGVVSLTEEQRRGAPAFYRERDYAWSDRVRERELHDYWRVPYYWGMGV